MSNLKIINSINMNDLKYKLIEKKIDNIKYKYEATNIIEDLISNIERINIIWTYGLIGSDYRQLKINETKNITKNINNFVLIYMLINKVRQKQRLHNEIVKIRDYIDYELIDKIFIVILLSTQRIQLSDNNIEKYMQNYKIKKTKHILINIYQLCTFVKNIQNLNTKHNIVQKILQDTNSLYIKNSTYLSSVDYLNTNYSSTILEYKLTKKFLDDFFKKNITSKYKEQYYNICLNKIETLKTNIKPNKETIDSLKIKYCNNKNMISVIKEVEKEIK